MTRPFEPTACGGGGELGGHNGEGKGRCGREGGNAALRLARREEGRVGFFAEVGLGGVEGGGWGGGGRVAMQDMGGKVVGMRQR